MSGYWTLEQGGASLPPAWLSGNSQFSVPHGRPTMLTEAAVCQLATVENRNYLHTCPGLANEGQESQTKCVGVPPHTSPLLSSHDTTSLSSPDRF